MGRSRGKNDKELEENEQTIKELKAANRRLKSDNERLKAELSTLQEAFNKTSSYLKGNTDNISVEKIIEGVKKGSTLQEIKQNNKCEKCGSHNVKELSVINVGKIILCTECKKPKGIEEMKKKKEPILSTKDPRFRNYLLAYLRRISKYWEPAKIALNKNRLGRGIHQCPLCNEIKKSKEMKKDHIDPVIPVSGFTNWDDIINRLFVEESGWQGICETCHDAKTKKENEQRRALRKEKAVLGYYKKKEKER